MTEHAQSDAGSGAGNDNGLTARVLAELRTLAKRHMSGERDDHTLQATALVNEAWLRLRDELEHASSHPGRFHVAAAQAMRRILIEHARRRGRKKRGGGLKRVPLDAVQAVATCSMEQVLALDDAIEALAVLNKRTAMLVRLRFFAGLSEIEAAETLGISERTARREWQYARAWLYRSLK